MANRLFGVFNRFADNASKMYRAVLFQDDQFVETGEFNELQSILQREISSLGDQSLGKISLRSGGGYRIDKAAAKVHMAKAVIWAGGYLHDVPAKVLDIPLLGRVKIGIVVDEQIVTSAMDDGLKGIATGQSSEGQDLANRLKLNARWAKEGEGEPFYPILDIENGVPLKDVEAPFSQQIENPVERHIRESHGSHKVDDGLQVRWVGFGLKADGWQSLNISKGAVRANGRLIRKSLDTPFAYEELPKLETVNGEVHTFTNPDAGGIATIQLRNGPIASIDTLTVDKRVTQNVQHALAGVSDALPLGPVVDIVEARQGATVFVKGVDYRLDGNSIKWLKPATEPDPGSTVSVTWTHTATVQPVSFERQSLRVSGGYDGGQVRVNYKYKLPRLDLICIDQDGHIVHLRGVPTKYKLRAPNAPEELAVLVKITNLWGIEPLIEAVGPPAFHEKDIAALFRRMDLVEDKSHQALMRTQAATRDPSSERGWLSENFKNQTQRDKGRENSAAIVDGLLQLPIDMVSERVKLGSSLIMLPYVGEIVLVNDWRTTERKVNEYQEFNPTPGVLELDPPIDRWTDTETTNLPSVTTNRMVNGGGVSSVTRLVNSENVQAEFLRQITVNFKASNFAPGEVLTNLNFDGQALPLPEMATVGPDGTFNGQFSIPAGVPAGAKLVELVGTATRSAAVFVGEGEITRETWQTTISFLAPAQESDEGDNSDPVAQSFALSQDRVLLGFDIECTARGDASNHLIGNLRLAEKDMPTGPSLTEGIVAGDFALSETGPDKPITWTHIAYRNAAPVLAGVKHCIGVLTEDANHSVAVSYLDSDAAQAQNRTSGFDARKQLWSTRQQLPGQFSDSPNHDGYVLHPQLDLTCRVHAARFTSNSRVVEIGQFGLNRISDIRVEMLIYDFGLETNVMLELVRANGEVIRFLPNEHLQLDEYLTEQVTLRMVLMGNERVSPLVSPDVTIFWGTLQEQAVYSSQAIGVDVADSNAHVRVIYEENTPGSSSVTAVLDDNGIYEALADQRSVDLGDNWLELEKALLDFNQPVTHAKITLEGSPADRPNVRDLRVRAAEI